MKAKILYFFFLQLVFLFLFFVFPKSVYAQVLINEFSVIPADRYDWVEIYSPTTIDVSNWSLKDEAGEFHKIPENTELGPGVYYTTDKYQRLNNDKDTIFLYDSTGKLIDSIKYGYEEEVCVPRADGSIARIPDGSNLYDRLLVHTKGVSNGTQITDPCPAPTTEPTPTPTNSPTQIPTPTPKTTATSTSTPKPTVKQTSTPKATTTSVSLDEETDNESLVLGLREELKESPSPTPESEEKKNFPLFALGFVFVGVGFLGFAGYSFFIQKEKGYTGKSENGKENSTLS